MNDVPDFLSSTEGRYSDQPNHANDLALAGKFVKWCLSRESAGSCPDMTPTIGFSVDSVFSGFLAFRMSRLADIGSTRESNAERK